MNRNKQITFVTNDINFFLSHRSNLIDVCKNLNIKINLLAPSYNTKNIILKDINIIKYFLDPRGKNPFLEFYSLLNLCTKLCLIKSDIYHFISFKPILYGSLVIKFFSKGKSVYSFSGLGFFKNLEKKKITTRILIFLLKIILNNKKDTTFIFQNTRDLKIMSTIIKSIDKSQLILINGSGINNKYYFNIFNKKKYTNKFVFTFASRLLIEKGILDFIKAAEYFLNSNDTFNLDVEFIIAGRFINNHLVWKNEKEFTSYLDKFDNKVKYVGNKKNIDNIFLDTNVIVLPTYYGEGVPKILCESLAAGIPIITTFQRGCRELVNFNKNGLICKSNDYLDLAKKFNEILNLSQKELNIISQNCIKYAKSELSLSSISAQHEKIYKAII